MIDSLKLSRLIKTRSYELGFELCGISPVKHLSEHEAQLRNWLDSGYNAEMSYMDRNFDKRLDPKKMHEGARSVISLALNYYQDEARTEDSPVFSKYAYGNDYHKILKDKIYLLLDYIRSLDEGAEGRVFVDSAPVLERAWAVESGIGWIGKNSMLINRVSGSFIFLGELILNLDLNYDQPEVKDYCGSCTLCIDACPTAAILDDRRLDSSLCISYLSIEKRGEFKVGDKISLHGNVFGCDICQDVCPWNRKAKTTREKSFSILPEIKEFNKDDWERITEEEFNSIFRDSPVLRTTYKGFKRNLDS